MAKFKQDHIQQYLTTLESVTYNKFGNHSFVAGVYGSIIAHLFEQLPKHQQAEMIANISSLTAKYAPAIQL
jgi:hypothetical protein